MRGERGRERPRVGGRGLSSAPPWGFLYIVELVLIKCSPQGAGERGLKRRSGVVRGLHNSSDKKTRKEDEKPLESGATSWEMPNFSLL